MASPLHSAIVYNSRPRASQELVIVGIDVYGSARGSLQPRGISRSYPEFFTKLETILLCMFEETFNIGPHPAFAFDVLASKINPPDGSNSISHLRKK